MPKDLRAVANRGARLMALSLALVLVFDSGCARRQRGPSEHELISEALSVYETGFEMEREGDDPRARDAYERSLAISPRPIADRAEVDRDGSLATRRRRLCESASACPP